LELVRIKGSRVLAVAMALLGCLLLGCSAGYPSDASSAKPTASSARPPSIPPDGITLTALGYLNGPVQQFSLPRTAVITAKVDQPNNVAAVGDEVVPASRVASSRFRDHCGSCGVEHDDFYWSWLEWELHRR
jgi:hypothetical protein